MEYNLHQGMSTFDAPVLLIACCSPTHIHVFEHTYKMHVYVKYCTYTICLNGLHTYNSTHIQTTHIHVFEHTYNIHVYVRVLVHVCDFFLSEWPHVTRRWLVCIRAKIHVYVLLMFVYVFLVHVYVFLMFVYVFLFLHTFFWLCLYSFFRHAYEVPIRKIENCMQFFRARIQTTFFRIHVEKRNRGTS